MPFIDKKLEFNFVAAGLTNDGTRTIGANVYDAGEAFKLFGAGRRQRPRMWFKATIGADDNATLNVQLVGADNAALTSNPVILADTGVIAQDDAGATITTVATIERNIEIPPQLVAKRYYGIFGDLGGTNPDISAAQPLVILWDAQTNLYGVRAAIPA